MGPSSPEPRRCLRESDAYPDGTTTWISQRGSSCLSSHTRPANAFAVGRPPGALITRSISSFRKTIRRQPARNSPHCNHIAHLLDRRSSRAPCARASMRSGIDTRATPWLQLRGTMAVGWDWLPPGCVSRNQRCVRRRLWRNNVLVSCFPSMFSEIALRRRRHEEP